ncbi:amidohydrolase family protein [Frankia sp. AgB1.9]|uniref:amidohydrolase family protein n=1 Tax=unclassified Frankia TaxID=2632575 RepID=UPI00193244EA|nr:MULTISPECIES: amidohydrolase family protein [unclassified Frankia]MBL7490855.1 amidohydrolase family protein [Frankia sp. AgW1.1]MBL7550907.1 amidohydrolase family protein [Frankia sp. AgB1.9]MBL7624416.1 amidohydrolase family protein [Frankia sp. AgB1.8]
MSAASAPVPAGAAPDRRTATTTILFRDVLVYDRDAPGHATGPTDVLVVGNRIAAVGTDATRPGRPNPDRVVAGHGHHLLIPGMINAHFHSPANHLKGDLPSMPLELFMLFETPADAEPPSPREAYLRTMLAALEMLRTGTTSVQDDAFIMPWPEPEIIDAVLAAYRDCGIRAAVALDQPELAETEKLPFLDGLAPAELRAALDAPGPRSRDELLELYGYLFDTWHGAAGGRLTAAVSISAPQRVSPEYFAALNELSARHHVPLYAHMLETKTQRVLADAQPRFAGRSLVRYTADLGLLNARTNVIHAVWTDDADLDLIAAAGAVVVHNPVSNLRLGSGVMPLRAMLDRGIPVALGVDEAICNDAADLWNVVKLAGLIHNVTGLDSERWPAPAEVLDALWTGGAAAMLRRGELGRIVPGALADLALLDLRSPAFTPLNDLAGQLVYCESGGSVVLTMVDGVVVAEHGTVTSVDEAALLAEARELFAAARPGLLARRAEGARRLYPTYQRMVRQAAAVDVGMTRWVGSR